MFFMEFDCAHILRSGITMIKFMPIRYWKNISLALFITGLTFTLVGTFCIKGNLVVHWSDEGVPNNFAGKWVLWALVLLSAISMLTYNSFTKEKAYSAGFGGPVSPEMGKSGNGRSIISRVDRHFFVCCGNVGCLQLLF